MKKKNKFQEYQGDPHPGSATETLTASAESKSAEAPKIDCAEAIYRAKQRIVENKKHRDRPLGPLLHAENELENFSNDKKALAAPKQNRPDPHLLSYQLRSSVNTRRTSRTFSPKITRETIQLYAAMESGDAIEAILDRQSCSGWKASGGRHLPAACRKDKPGARQPHRGA
jgi:hypothetical protein